MVQSNYFLETKPKFCELLLVVSSGLLALYTFPFVFPLSDSSRLFIFQVRLLLNLLFSNKAAGKKSSTNTFIPEYKRKKKGKHIKGLLLWKKTHSDDWQAIITVIVAKTNKEKISIETKTIEYYQQ